jgi:glutamate 5-kinase
VSKKRKKRVEHDKRKGVVKLDRARDNLSVKKRIVVKVGTSTLTYDNGRVNLSLMDQLARVLSNLVNQEKDVILVSSGSIGIGMEKIHFKSSSMSMGEKQAAAAIGQCELMHMYSKFFSDYGCTIGQILLTKDVVEEEAKRKNVMNTFENLLKNSVIPIVNENDTVSTEEIEYMQVFGDNDTLAAIVSELTRADLLVILSDIEGLCSENPKKHDHYHRISMVSDINKDIENLAQGAGSERGTGGMVTKIEAAKIATKAGIDMVIVSGEDPRILDDVLSGKDVGTYFVGRK